MHNLGFVLGFYRVLHWRSVLFSVFGDLYVWSRIGNAENLACERIEIALGASSLVKTHWIFCMTVFASFNRFVCKSAMIELRG